MRLSKRLAAVVDFVPLSGGVADIGTDHGLIPVYLAKTGRYAPIVAIDISEGPLSAARKNCQRYGVCEQISFRIGDGLSPLAPDEVSTIIIAGMGEATIIEILQRYQQIAETAEVLILQPTDGAARIRHLMKKLDWCIAGESVVSERGKFYQTVQVAPGRPFTLPNALKENLVGLSEEEIIALGPVLLARKDSEFIRMIDYRLNSLEAARRQIIAGSGKKHVARLRELGLEVAKLEKVIKWLHSDK